MEHQQKSLLALIQGNTHNMRYSGLFLAVRRRDLIVNILTLSALETADNNVSAKCCHDQINPCNKISQNTL